MAKALDAYIAYKFIQILTTSWEDTDAYKYGIIDDQGNLLKDVSELKSKAEKDAYSIFNRLVFNIKRLLSKIPGGNSRLATFSAALYLIKEEAGGSDVVEREFWYYMKNEHSDVLKEMISEQMISEGTLAPGVYKTKHDVIDERGNAVHKGTSFKVSRPQKSTDTVLGHDVYEVKTPKGTIVVSQEDIQKVR